MARNEEENQATRTAQVFGCRQNKCHLFCWIYDRCEGNEILKKYSSEFNLELEQYIDELLQTSKYGLTRDELDLP